MSGYDEAFPTPIVALDDGSIRTAVSMGLGGLTKRELFSAMAMQAILGQWEMLGPNENRVGSAAEVARFACANADALLAELAKERKDG